jgi:8-amino-7-oxononanoate synthase
MAASTGTCMKSLDRDMEQRRERGLYRERLVLSSPAGVEVQVGNERLLAFCSNDYLGLAADPRVIRAFQRGAEEYGVGSGASHLVSGHFRAHHALEEELADFTGRPRALLFSTGYMANLGVVGALTGRHDTLYEDRLNHASLIDAARLSQSKVSRYAHGDVAQLESRLASAPPAGGLIATDAVFSMDGDLAPLAGLQSLADRHGLYLLADDAHGLGVLGRSGRGSFEHLGVDPRHNTLLMGTLGKAFGVFGAFVAGSEAVIETLIQSARTYIYTTALPPAVAEALRASLRIVRTEGERREQLMTRVAQFRAGARQLGLALADSPTPIQPLILGSAEGAVKAAAQLRALGILVPAIRPPTVPAGSARLRITFSSGHQPAHVERLLEALGRLKIGT